MVFVVVEVIVRFVACMACLGVAMSLGLWFYKAMEYAALSGMLLDWLFVFGLLAGTTAFFGGACCAILPARFNWRRGGE